MSSAPDSPDLPSAPKWSDTYTYDSEGRLTGSITRDASGNTIYKPGALSATEQINKTAINQKKNEVLARLYKTPAEYTAAAQTEAEAWRANAAKPLQDSYEKNVNAMGNTMNTRGLLGSKAYADSLGQINKSKTEADASLAGQATSMRQGLLANKTGQDFNLYGLYNQAGQQYDAKSMAALSAAGNLSSASNSFNLNSYNSEVGAINSKYQNDMSSWQNKDPWRNYIMPTLQTGAYIAAAASDRRLKKNIVPAFKVGDVQFYSFEYDVTKWPEGFLAPQEGKHIGVMSDEVRHIPGAVKEGLFNGFDIVDYEAVRDYLKMEKA